MTIPFADELAKRVPVEQVRMRRDFTQLLTLIQVHALLYQRQRARSEDGRIVADERDYAAVYELAAPIFKAIAAAGVTPQVRETVEAVRQHAVHSDKALKIAELAKMLKLDRSTVQRRVTRALDGGFLVNIETREKQPTKLLLGDPLPDDKPALPSPEEVFIYPPCTSAQAHKNPENPHVDAENDETTACTSHAQGRTSEGDLCTLVQTSASGENPDNPHVDAENDWTSELVHLCAADREEENEAHNGDALSRLEAAFVTDDTPRLCPRCEDRPLDTAALRHMDSCTICMTEEEYEQWKPIAYSFGGAA